MTKSRFRNTVLGIGATAAAIAVGYFGVQQLGRNNMFTIAAAVGGAGAISYVLQKPNQPQAPSNQPEPQPTPMKTQRKGRKS
ncbi:MULTISPECIES: hypothetical protein [Nostoc]|uniref:Uncharacterized protein n=2 Tax=Nostoc TaxID=1177 RepID=A0ABR8IFE8_9NOSO|nr:MULTISPECIES: hypothetical protein [Nostoc]MBD2565870.1 hypothetical protein [Nostoc linckia FACHB-391]MBD2650153.1 hypothetical protein [Nostoc foliaceum FACHB-393]